MPQQVQETLLPSPHENSFIFHCTFSRARFHIQAFSFFIEFERLECYLSILSPNLSAYDDLPLGLPSFASKTHTAYLIDSTVSDTLRKTLIYFKRVLSF